MIDARIQPLEREMARILGVKEGSVRVLLFRARQKAARELARQEVKS